MSVPGYVILLGSGERSPHIRTVYQWLFEQLGTPIHIAILETPAGFELNSDYVAGRIGDYIQEHLPNFDPAITIVPARKRNTAFSPDDPAIVQPMYDANVLFVGPGSPSYAVRQLRNSLAWDVMRARHRLGAATIIASAATLAMGIEALPIYEIYKVGEDLHWKAGLNLFGPYGLSLVFIPHWNNQEGGAVLDTRRCYMGLSRYVQLVEMLPPGRTIVGIDESTALIVDLARQECRVMGMGGATIVEQGDERRYETGQRFGVTELGPFQPLDPETGLPASILAQARDAVAEAQRRQEEKRTPPPEVMALVEQREAARESQDWATADALRDQIQSWGWQLMDTPEGAVLEPFQTGQDQR